MRIWEVWNIWILLSLFVLSSLAASGADLKGPYDPDEQAWKDEFSKIGGKVFPDQKNWYDNGQCTWFARAVTNHNPFPVPRGRGNAWQWLGHYQNAGFKTGKRSEKGAIAVWNLSAVPGTGHVALVTKLLDDGSFEVWDSNWHLDERIYNRKVSPNKNIDFIYCRLVVESISPQDRAINVPSDSEIVIGFNFPIDPASVGEGAYLVGESELMEIIGESGLPTPSLNPEWSVEGKTLRWKNWHRKGYTQYRIILTPKLRSLNGMSIRGVRAFRFTTLPYDPLAFPKVLDLVLVIDHTTSMGDDIAKAKQQASETVRQVSKAIDDLRLAVVTYGDRGDSLQHVDCTDFTSDVTTAIGYINKISLYGGAIDMPEDVFDGLEAAVKADFPGSGWRENAVHVVILIGDAPQKRDQELMLQRIANKGLENKVFGFCIVADNSSGGTRECFGKVARALRGAVMDSDRLDELVSTILLSYRMSLMSEKITPIGLPK